MQTLVSVNTLTRLKLLLADENLEKVLIVLKVILLMIVIFKDIGATTAPRDRLLGQVAATRAALTITTIDKISDLMSSYEDFSKAAQSYSYQLVDIKMQQFTLTDEGAQCKRFECMESLIDRNKLFEGALQPTDASKCSQSDCPEFKPASKENLLLRSTYFEIEPTYFYLYYQRAQAGNTIVDYLVQVYQSGWVSKARTQQLVLESLFRSTIDDSVYCILLDEIKLSDPILRDQPQQLHFFVDSTLQFYCICILLAVLILSLAKPMVEYSVAPNKWIYFVSIYIKITWIAYAAIKLSAKITASKYVVNRQDSTKAGTALIYLDRTSVFLLHMLITVFPFEILKLLKRTTFLQSFFNILSTIYGALLSIKSFAFILTTTYLFLSLGAYIFFMEFIDMSLPTFVLHFITSDVEFEVSSLLDKAFWTMTIFIRYLLWVYTLSICLFYFHLVSTHVFTEFEPRFYKQMVEKISGINKSMDNFSNEILLMRSSNSAKSQAHARAQELQKQTKRRKIIIWLNYGNFQLQDQYPNYSDGVINLFKDIKSRNIGLSTFNDFKEVQSFMKAIYNIMPKIIMSTTKSVRIVVNVFYNPQKRNRTEFELDIFVKMQELNAFIDKMGLDTEILLFEETEEKIFKSRIYHILDTSFARIKVTNKQRNLSMFCKMFNFEDIQTRVEPEEENNNILDLDDMEDQAS